MRNVKLLPFAGVALLTISYAAGPPARFWPAYLVSWLFATTVAAGALFFVLIHHLTRAGWSVVLRRQAESIASAIPVLALLFVPIALHLESIYPWTQGAAFFRLRAFAYLGFWSAVAWWFRRLSVRQDMSGSLEVARSMRRASAPALVLFGVTLTFAAFDWVMSLEPHWFSSVFGVYFFAGSAVAYFAFQSAASALVHSRGLTPSVTAEHFHGLGKLLFGFVCFWAYIAFSQYLLIWYANLPEETVWYAHRLRGSWGGAAFALASGQFLLPFFVLLSANVKRSPRLLAACGAFLLAMHYLDLYWLVIPATGITSPHWIDLVTLAGTTSVLAGVTGILMDRVSLTPSLDPRLEESLSFDNA